MYIKILKKGHTIYGAKNKKIGHKILDFTRNVERRTRKKCAYDNISWFSDIDQSKQYHTSDTSIFQWITLRNTRLLTINKQNEKVFQQLFFTNIKLNYTLKINQSTMDKIKKLRNDYPIYLFQHPFLFMSNNERAYYEFQFVFGYLTVHEQYLFLELMYYLLKYKISEINKRDGTSISNKVYYKMKYYSLYPFKKQEKYNRLSFYELDKNAIVNVCTTLCRGKIDGVLQPDSPSFWYPDLKVYRMNIKEYILFAPHHVLEYKKRVE